MLKGPQRELLGTQGLRYVTSLTDPQIRKKLSEGVLQLALFTERVAEVVADEVRYILRRNPATAERHHSRRSDQIKVVQTKVAARNETLAKKPRAKLELALEYAQHLIARFKLTSFVSASVDARRIVLDVDEGKRRGIEELDGCYVVISDVPHAAASALSIRERHGDLQKVERNFRTMKTGLPELQPIFLPQSGTHPGPRARRDARAQTYSRIRAPCRPSLLRRGRARPSRWRPPRHPCQSGTRTLATAHDQGPSPA